MDTRILNTVNDFYETAMFADNRSGLFSAIDKIAFFNVGYWKGQVNGIEHAQINLIETLVEFLLNRDGNILDVACGKGASTKFLTKYFEPQNITGINISERQLQFCRLLAPECTFKLMDATDMQFADASFDNVICIEGADHFLTRFAFLSEAHRILRPGGRLAMWDFLYDKSTFDQIGHAFPPENYLPDLEAYRNDVLRAGFKYVRVEDVTEFGYKKLIEYVTQEAEAQFEKKRNYQILEDIMAARKNLDAITICIAFAIN